MPRDDIDAFVAALASLKTDLVRRAQFATARAPRVRAHDTASGMAESAVGIYAHLVDRHTMHNAS